MKQKITPFLWFDNNLEEAFNFYISIFPHSKMGQINKGPDGKAFTGTIELCGQEIMGLNGGPEFKFTEAISFFVDCDNQTEVDEYWNKILENGGQESQCGWIKDKFGLSWQIIPKALGELLGDKDPQKSSRVMEAMLKMGKIDESKLREAYENK